MDLEYELSNIVQKMVRCLNLRYPSNILICSDLPPTIVDISIFIYMHQHMSRIKKDQQQQQQRIIIIKTKTKRETDNLALTHMIFSSNQLLLIVVLICLKQHRDSIQLSK
jgi:uncharacterized membrane protein